MTQKSKSSAPHTSRISIPVAQRADLHALLNQQLVDTLDLYASIKEAHWNVTGPQFIALHELFDSMAGELLVYADDMAERLTTLGGIAQGGSRYVAANSRLSALAIPPSTGMTLVAALADLYAALGTSTRDAIDAATTLSDADTADLFTGVSRGLDKSLWILEAHLRS